MAITPRRSGSKISSSSEKETMTEDITIAHGESATTAHESANALIRSHFAASASATVQASARLSSDIALAAETIIAAFLANHKLLCFGDAESALEANYLASKLTGQLEQSRPGLPALWLNETTSLVPGEAAVARQIRALGNPGDVFLLLSARDETTALIEAIHAARERELRLIAFVSRGSRAASELSGNDDVVMLFDEQRIIRVLELQRVCIHALCDVIDSLLLGDG
jgi:D-sedoheptulose 7-phosphate isomerase